jgi:hypothetical protein
VKVETDVEHADLDDDGDEDSPMTLVFVSICMPDGMRYTGQVACDAADPTPAQLAEMLIKAAQGAGQMHSPQLGRMLELWSPAR